jgi:uncharacterized protein (TIGR03086 family)
MTEGAAAIAAALRDIGDGADLTSPTPCADFDLATLVNHALGTTTALAKLAQKESLDPDDPWGSRTDDTEGDWPNRLADRLQATAAAWDDPAAWNGSLDLGGGEQPAASIGEMAFVEVMLHGWDVARAVGRRPDVPDTVGTELLQAASGSADLGRQMGAYGPEVETTADASDFEKALGVAGRDPNWSPAS